MPAASHPEAIAATPKWQERSVIGLLPCPFARPPRPTPHPIREASLALGGAAFHDAAAIHLSTIGTMGAPGFEGRRSPAVGAPGTAQE